MTEQDIQSWINSHVAAADRFADVATATAEHREEHGCDAYESLPQLDEGARNRDALFSPAWLTAFVNGKALTVRRR